jgi:N-acetylglutamate synthase-like GNAT family acetyltransferase|tara:strand:- start:1346 stop:1759 length:414 start_codon:yes stop_codon:yes gene_type:complete
MIIRKAINNDSEKIKKLVKETLEEIFNSPAEGLEDLENINENFELFLIAEDDGEIIGTVGLKNEGDARISRMYVKESKREAGIGKQLIGKVFNYCNGRFDRIILTTYPQMKSEQFYNKMGFKKFKQDERIWMEKKLK